MEFLFRKIALFVPVIGFIGFYSCSESSPTFPETCKGVQELAVKDTGNRPVDGTYTLYAGSDETKPWEAYCYQMNRSEPVEYLTVDEDSNFSEISSGTSVVVTHYRRYRIDPESLEIDPLDDTFATTEGTSDFMPDDRSHIPAGWAQFRSSSNNDGPEANSSIDLDGTAFAFSEEVLDDDFFCTVSTGGNGDSSSVTIQSDLLKVTLTAINDTANEQTKAVGDCTNLSVQDNPGTDDFTSAAYPLQYIEN